MGKKTHSSHNSKLMYDFFLQNSHNSLQDINSELQDKL